LKKFYSKPSICENSLKIIHPPLVVANNGEIIELKVLMSPNPWRLLKDWVVACGHGF